MKPSSRARLRQRGYAAILTVAVIIIAVAILAIFPEVALWLPNLLYGK